MIRFSATLVLLFIFHSLAPAQSRRFREHEVIDAGNGLKIEILNCRGAGDSAECDVIYYTEKRQQGKRLWEKVNKIIELEQAAKAAIAENKQFNNPSLKKEKNKKEAIKQTAPVAITKPVSPIIEKELPGKNQKDSVIITPPEITNPIPSKEIIKYNVSPAHIYTLQQCFRLALNENLTLKRAQNNINAFEIDRKTAQYSLLPSLSYNLGHYFSFGKNIDPVTNTFINETFSGGYTALGLQLQLFSGFSKLNTIKQSRYLVEASEYAKKKAELELLSNVTLTYARLLLNKELLLLQRNDMQSTTKQLDIINEKIKVGRLTKYESYAFTARLSTEQANLVTIQNDSSAALQDLKQLLNIPYKQAIDVAPIDTVALSEIYGSPIFISDYIDTVLQKHPAIKQAQMDEQAAQLGLKIARANLYPSLAIGGNVATNYNVNQLNSSGQKIPLNTQLNNNIGKNINISLRVPIFSQMENTNRIKKEKINISNAQLNRQEAEMVIVKNTLQIINDFNAARQKYMATLSAREQNYLSYTLYEEKYKLGQVSSLELLTAKDLLNAAASKYLQAKLELYFRYHLLLLLKNTY